MNVYSFQDDHELGVFDYREREYRERESKKPEYREYLEIFFVASGHAKSKFPKIDDLSRVKVSSQFGKTLV